MSNINALRRLKRKTYVITVIAVAVILAFSMFVFAIAQKSTYVAAISTLPSSPTFFSSIDTMKVSRDTETHPLSLTEIQQIVQVISSLHPNYITVDTHWDYPDYMQEWINAIRAVHLHIWFREHPNQWENDNGAMGTMTPQAYENTEQQFIVAHPSFFQSGDIFKARGPDIDRIIV